MIEVKYELLDDKCFVSYLEFLTGKVFKILPISENEPNTLKIYLESLMIELKGSQDLFEKIRYDISFLQLISTIQYFISNEDYEHKILKREVFKCINIIKKLLDKYGGD